MSASRLQTERVPNDLVAHVRALAATRPSDTALIVAAADTERTFSYSELDLRARAVAAELQARFAPGDRALLLLENNEHYVVGFLACLYAGLIAVPAFPPESLREHHIARLRAIASDALACCALVSSDLLGLIGKAKGLLREMHEVIVDTVSPTNADRWQSLTRNERDVIFLQYTSGSTAAPKGVIVDHGNLLANERVIGEALQTNSSDVFVSWLPLFHDMGLVGGLFQPIYRGIPLVLTSPAYFLERPVRWLQLISRHRGTISGGPDFAYRLCLERVSDAQLKSLDLSSWRVAFSGAEPVRHDTLHAFADRFKAAGFDAQAIYPCYGLAEATLFVTGGHRDSGLTTRTYSSKRLAKGRAATARLGTTLVACGVTHSRHRIRIVDPETGAKQPDTRIGEIWVTGPSVSRGYWQRDEETAAAFVERDGKRWLRTGDLGFVQHRQLFITGRQKDLIILRGHNVYPQDIERAIETEIEAVRKGRVAAFAVQTPTGEGVGVAVEISRSLQKLVPAERLIDELSAVVSEQCHEPLSVAVLLNPGALPKTSSGKVQRSACRARWRSRTLDAFGIYEYGEWVRGVGGQTQSSAPLDDMEHAVANIWRSVLKCDIPGPDANFFVSGGNSLSAVQIASRMSDHWNVEFPVRAIFERPRLNDVASEIKTLLRAGGRRESPPVTALAAEIRNQPLPLSFAQQRLWFLWQLDPANTAYHICGRFRFSGQMNVEVVRESFDAIVQRHESLRTVFRAEDGEARQIVLPTLAPDVTSIDVRASVDDSRLAAELRRVQETPFDLSAGPLLRVGAIRLADAQWLLVIAIHHIVSDGWSVQLMLNEFAEYYAARLEGRDLREDPLALQYVDYAAWQREWLGQGATASQLRWWRERLGDEHPVLELPVDRRRRQATAYAPGRHEFELPEALVRGLRKRAGEQGTTLFTVLLAAFQVLLHRYTNQRDVRVGVPVANRNLTASEGIIGFFVNTLVLKCEIDAHLTLAEVLSLASQTVRHAQAHQDLPFGQLVEALQPERDLSQSPLFRVVMNHLRVNDQGLARLPGLRLEDYWIGKQAAQFELALDTVESVDSEVIARFTYAVDLFESETIARWGEHYLRVLEQVASQPERQVRDVELLGEREQARLRRWSENPTSFPEACHIHSLVEQHAAESPDAIAVLCDDQALRYGELNARANRLAHRLIALGVTPETRVGVAMERSIDLVVALLGIMKAGGAYVPLDPAYPAERLSYMIQDSGISLLLMQSSFEEPLASIPVRNLSILVPDETNLRVEPSHDPAVALHADNLVYVIYTSGSTGKPKGAANCHGALYNRLMWGQQFDPLRPDDVVMQKTPFTFDISFWEFFWPLTAGAKLLMLEPGAHRDPLRLLEMIRRHAVTTIHFVPSMLQAFMSCQGVETCTTLRRMICSGEALPVEAQGKVFARLPAVKLHNFYGPTEAAIEVTHWTCASEDRTSVPIGRPIAATRAIILDQNLRIAPQGVVGELYLGGTPLARGYPTRPGLTAERFIADPNSSDGARLYRTGDLARWRSDGQIEYLGRVDHQVKIRGHRIELGEIEAELMSRAEVREAMVVARDGEGSKRLVAYVVPAEGTLEALDVESSASQAVLVDQWESVFESAHDAVTVAPDFRGWNSSYNDQPIPEAQMQEWLDATVERISALAPTAILEIGCGVGLLVQHLAPKVSRYVATDFAARAVTDLRSWLRTQAQLSHVEVRQAEASDFSALPSGQFDTIVLNSVIQYFPSADYLLEALGGAARAVGPQGRIFVGDVRHLAHLPTFHASVQLAKAPAALAVRQLKSRIRRAIAQDKELVLDPGFFHAVAPHLQVAGVEIQLKRGYADNELTRYRYDVVLHMQASVRSEVERSDWSRFDNVDELARHLATCRPVALRLLNVPNLRVARDVAAWRLVQASDDRATVAEVRAQLDDIRLVGIDPEALWTLGEQQGYIVRIAWAAGIEDGCVDVELIERSWLASGQPAVTAPSELPAHWRSLASDPLRLLRTRQLQARLRDHLSRTVPEYMVPSAVVVLESLPLNANGKLDRKALPEPEFASGERYEAPVGEAERAVAAVWSDVLGVERIGRNDNFFELGGDSILSLQIVARARIAGWRITARQLFERQTIAQLAAVAEPFELAAGVDAETPRGAVPLLPIQAWFFEQEIPARHHWNQSVLLRARERLHTDALARALETLVQHHDALRLRYTRSADGSWQQRYADDATGHDLLWVRDARSSEQTAKIEAEAQRSLNLSEGPLLRAVAIRASDGSDRLLLAIHHLAVDGVSWRILLQDLQRAYEQAKADVPVVLPAKTSSYQRWADALRQYAGKHAEELSYWQRLIDVPVELPCDDAEGSNTLSDQATVTLQLDREQTQALIREVPAAYRTQINDALLTALGRALCSWSRCDRILIDLEGHGREDLFEDIDVSRTVGWFTSLYPIALEPLGELGGALKRVKQTLREVPNKGLGYGALQCWGSAEQRQALAAMPCRQVVFNYLGQFDSSFDDSAPWMPVAESVGASMDARSARAHEFSINGQVFDGSLQLHVSYSWRRHRRDVVQRFVDRWQEELKALIQHCSSGVSGVTPSDFPLAQLTQAELDALPIPLRQAEDLYPMTALQQGLLFHSLQDPEGGAYVNQLRMDIEGLDGARFKAAWQAAVNGNDVLRTGFLHERELPLQWVSRSVQLPFVEHDWCGCDDMAVRLEELAVSERKQPFDLIAPPLMRCALVRTSQRQYHFIWTHHHVLMDGWSTVQLVGDVLRQYHQQALPPSRSRYRDYIQWLLLRDARASEQYWNSQLRRLEEPTRLVSALPKSAGGTGYAEHLQEFDASGTQRLVEFARRERVTLNTLVQGAWALLLSRYTGRSSVTFGATTAGRPAELAGVERLIGLFINTFPVIAQMRAEQTTGEWLRELQAHNIASREHEHTPLHEIQRWANAGSQGLFDTLLVFENYPVDRTLREGMTRTLRFSSVRYRDRTHYPLTVVVTHGETMTLRYGAGSAFLTKETMASVAMHMHQLLEELTVSALRPLGDLQLLTAAEQAALAGWSENDQSHPATQPVHRLIEQQAKRRSAAPALIFGEIHVSYAELNERANRLAHRLMRLGAKPEVRVGLAVERSIEMVVGLLAILKAGAAYVPLDTDYPAERLSYMMRDSGIELLVTQSAVADRLPSIAGITALPIDTLDLRAEPEHDPVVAVHADNLAYVIYTSGSTGKPKGAQLCHRNVTRLLAATREWFLFNDRDVWTLFHSYAFDFSVWEIFGALCHGGKLLIVPFEVSRSPDDFLRLLRQQQVTVLNQTPSAFKQLLEVPSLYTCGDLSLRAVIFGGEALDPQSLRPWIEHFGDAEPRLINMYGITETTVHVTYRPITRSDLEAPRSPIGERIPDLGLRVLDPELNPVPIGIPGELYVSGDGLARGYLNRAELTCGRFVANPFSTAGERLYRTGDLVRWAADRQLEYLGRVDHQVKIRGFRIELGEIESLLRAQPEVREAVVVAKQEPDGARLVGYVAAAAGYTIDVSVLRERLVKTLPDYMVPRAIVVLERLPLNANGKLDRKALPSHDVVSRQPHEAPRGKVGAALAAIWAEVLGIDQVGAGDNFFDLGGHSLQIIRVHRLIEGRLRSGLTIVDLFKYPTIEALTRRIEQGPGDAAPAGSMDDETDRAMRRRATLARRRRSIERVD